MPTPTKAKDKDDIEPSICQALKHPIRARILEIVNEMPISPSKFVRQGLVPDEFFENYNQAVSLVSYHFDQLAEEGCVEIVERVPVRGVYEKVYRGVSRVFFSDDEFEALPFDDRKGLSKTSFQGVVARTDGAIRSGTFDARTDRHLTWRAFQCDEQGWADMTAILADAFYKLEDARKATRERLDAQDDDAGFPATFAMLGFESPPIKLRF
jgi:DNA-binding transcriptional ArsR family regulator